MVELPAAMRQLRPGAVLAVGVCCLSLLFDVLGYLLAGIGLLLVWRAPQLPPRVKWALTALVVLPRLLFALIRIVHVPPAVSFALEPYTVATSVSVWFGWALFAATLGLVWYGVHQYLRRWTTVAAIVCGVAMLAHTRATLGLRNDFERVEATGDGRWQLTHAVRGKVVVFRPADVAAVEAKESTVGRTRYQHVRFAMRDGATYQMTTTNGFAIPELSRAATTMNLPPNAMRSVGRFDLEQATGTYVNSDGARKHVLRIALENGLLTGTETLHESDVRQSRDLSGFRVAANGEFKCNRSASSSRESTPDRLRLSFATASEVSGRFRAGVVELNGKVFTRETEAVR